MVFNSHHFVFFATLFYVGYWLLRGSLKNQNRLLLFASYFFYLQWGPQFLLLLLATTFFDFWIGSFLHKATQDRTRKMLVVFSILLNVGVLALFKYGPAIFQTSPKLWASLSTVGPLLPFLYFLPPGISFYTFQSMSYTIDIYRRQLRPARTFRDFALFVSYYPQLVAGPIERATHLLPQVEKPRTLNAEEINEGLFLILWGYFKKIVIADNVALIANPIFQDYLSHGGFDYVVGGIAFSIQIYCDFSGYSDIARGLGKTMGFDIMENFRLPYFAKNPSDFWNRWHISLSTWFKDYLYIPLGGNRISPSRTYINLFLTMAIAGVWHGASLTFLVWGIYHAFLLIAHRLIFKGGRFSLPIHPRFTPFINGGKILGYFSLTLVGWMIFRSSTLGQAWHMIGHSSFVPAGDLTMYRFAQIVLYSFPLIIIQIAQFRSGDMLFPCKLRVPLRSCVYALLFLGILMYGAEKSFEFIYFQF